MIISYGMRQIVLLDSFYVTDSPLSVTKIAELAKFYLKWPVLMIIPWGWSSLFNWSVKKKSWQFCK